MGWLTIWNDQASFSSEPRSSCPGIRAFYSKFIVESINGESEAFFGGLIVESIVGGACETREKLCVDDCYTTPSYKCWLGYSICDVETQSI